MIRRDGNGWCFWPCCSPPVFSFPKDRPFPADILSAKSVAVIGRLGAGSADLRDKRAAELKAEAEARLKDWGRYQIVDDPSKSDLVIVLLERFPLADTIALWHTNLDPAAMFVFKGGTNPQWNGVPLWATSLLHTHAVTVAINNFEKPSRRRTRRQSRKETDHKCSRACSHSYYAQAKSWCKKSQVPFAYVVLGRMAERGLGQEKNMDEALEFYRDAAILGAPDGYMDSGRLRRESGSREGLKEAYFWYAIAAQYKFSGAADKLKEVVALLTEKEVAEASKGVTHWLKMPLPKAKGGVEKALNNALSAEPSTLLRLMAKS